MFGSSALDVFSNGVSKARSELAPLIAAGLPGETEEVFGSKNSHFFGTHEVRPKVKQPLLGFGFISFYFCQELEGLRIDLVTRPSFVVDRHPSLPVKFNSSGAQFWNANPKMSTRMRFSQD